MYWNFTGHMDIDYGILYILTRIYRFMGINVGENKVSWSWITGVQLGFNFILGTEVSHHSNRA